MEALTAIRDTREQDGYTLAPMDLRVEGLQTGDYSVAGLEDMIALERKTLPDLVSCIGSGRERFLRELQRLKAHPFRAVVIEGLWSDLEDGHYQSRLNPDSATHSIISWQSRFCLALRLCWNQGGGGAVRQGIPLPAITSIRCGSERPRRSSFQTIKPRFPKRAEY